MHSQKIDQQIRSNDCGISAVKTIYNIYGKPISRDYITKNIPLEEKGSNLQDIRTFFKKNGFSAEYNLLDVNDIQGDLSTLKKIFPFILPIKSKTGLHYIIADSLRRGKIKIYDPGKGNQYYLSVQELKKKAHFVKSSWDKVKTEEALKVLCSEELVQYQIKIETGLLANENDLTKLFNKLTYFSYLKQNFGFKDFNAEKGFVTDLIYNQELSNIPKHFISLNYKKGLISIKAPLVLTVRPVIPLDTGSEYPKDENSNIYWQLYKKLGVNKKLWHIFIFAALFSSSVTQLAVFINQILIDHVLPSFNLRTLYLFAIGLSIYKLFDIFTSAFKGFVGVHLSNILDKFFLNEFDSKISRFSLPYIQSFKKGDLIERISDALKLKQFFTNFFTSVLIDIFISVYSLLILFYINWKLTLLVTGVMILFYIWFKFITPYLKQNERLRYIRKADFLSKIIEKIEGIQVIKSFGIEQNHSNIINAKVADFLKIQLKNGYISLVNSIVVALIVVTFSMLIVVMLTKSAIETQIVTLGQIITYIALSGKIFSSLKSILNQNLILQENEVILKRFLDFDEDNIASNVSNSGITDFSIDHMIIRDLSFGYSTGKDVLKRISLTFSKGEKIKVEGKNGSGKSTLSKILTALYTPNAGDIIINDIDSSFYGNDALKSKILLSTNEDILFNDTIEENVCLGRDLPVFKLIRLAKELDFYDFIISKEEKQDFVINENGKNLSTGQRKKVILMRALMSEAEVIILDEVLSGIDKDSRSKIERFINQDPRSFIIISHEPINEITFSHKYKIENGRLTTI
jgi:subfamily B ATP-binding cassette protein HlyB/CyaB